MSEEHAGFVDIHCHILPGVDDGARDVTEAVRMAQLAVGSGIRIIVTTPHHLPRSPLSAVEEAKRRVANLQRHVDDAHLDLTLHPGQENAARSDLTQRLAQQEAVSLNGSRYLLVEPPFLKNLRAFTGPGGLALIQDLTPDELLLFALFPDGD